MAAARYPLELVLEQRAELEREAQKSHAAACARLAAEEEELALKEAECGEVAAKRESERQRLSSLDPRRIADVGKHRRYLERLGADLAVAAARVDEQKMQVARAQRGVDEAQAALVEARKEREAIVKHKDKWLDEIRTDKERREEAEEDELGQMLHRRRILAEGEAAEARSAGSARERSSDKEARK